MRQKLAFVAPVLCPRIGLDLVAEERSDFDCHPNAGASPLRHQSRTLLNSTDVGLLFLPETYQQDGVVKAMTLTGKGREIPPSMQKQDIELRSSVGITSDLVPSKVKTEKSGSA